jgi:hypothetical protein
MILNSIPCHASYDLSDHHIGNSELPAESSLGDSTNGKSGSDKEDLFSRKFGSSNILTGGSDPTAFFPRIQIVIGIGTQEQMVRPNAIRNITPMKNVESIRNISKLHHPRQPVSQNVFVHDSDHSIPKGVSASVPDPTAVCFLDVDGNVYPESGRCCLVTVGPCPNLFSGHWSILPIYSLYNKLQFGTAKLSHQRIGSLT